MLSRRRKLQYQHCSLQVVVVAMGVVVVVLEDTVDADGEVGAVDVVIEDTDDVEVVVVTQAFTFNAKSSAYPLPVNLIVIMSTNCMLFIINLPKIPLCIQKFNSQNVPIFLTLC